MIRLLRVATVLILLCSPGCWGISEQAGKPADPKAVEVLLAHWQALQRREWRAAYDRLHPDLKTAGFTLKRFTALQAKRPGSNGFPRDIRIAGSEQTGDDLVISFDLLSLPPGGGSPVAISPRRKATLRRSGDSWGLMTHDLLALRP
jgi:hypothetical protein